MTDLPPADWPGDIGPIFLTEDEIQQRVAELGAQISRDYAGQDLILIGVLTGVFIFLADLMRAMTIPVTVDFLALSRYGPSEQTHGVVRLTKDLDVAIAGRHVLFVEDIIDTGFTTRFIMHTLRLREPASCRVCTLLNRARRRIIDIDLDYVGFDMPDYYVVGYGLDHDERYRNLPYLVRFDPDQLKQD
ncbi:MAG: hypoxanthine phosphoribosyltransferase [Anaerolineaceae bacterium]|nr:hypoxanthine phosphoribosyltransferase [Anaerolineaceae bacterium]